MCTPTPTEKVRPRSISLTNAQYRALARLAIFRGHLSRSRVVQELIDRDATIHLGPNWEAELGDEREGDAA